MNNELDKLIKDARFCLDLDDKQFKVEGLKIKIGGGDGKLGYEAKSEEELRNILKGIIFKTDIELWIAEKENEVITE